MIAIYMTYTDTHEPTITIANIEEATIINYFATINQEDFTDTAALFTTDGELLAPFEPPIIGPEAIASYLSKEARGMKLIPQQGIYEPVEDENQKIKIVGKVKTSLFSVNAAWYFSLNQNRQITTAKIKLLASPQELLGLKNQIESV